MAALLNKTVENIGAQRLHTVMERIIGAQRLHTVMERIMEHLSFEAAEAEKGTVLRVDKSLVSKRLDEVTKKTDLSKYIL
jgi:ATP-dependent HslUV protease ATP-binding subunit HslU